MRRNATFIRAMSSYSLPTEWNETLLGHKWMSAARQQSQLEESPQSSILKIITYPT